MLGQMDEPDNKPVGELNSVTTHTRIMYNSQHAPTIVDNTYGTGMQKEKVMVES